MLLDTYASQTVRNSKHLKWYFEMEDISVAMQLGLSSKSEDVTPVDLGLRKIAGHGVDGYLFKECIVCHTTRKSKQDLRPLMIKLWKDRTNRLGDRDSTSDGNSP